MIKLSLTFFISDVISALRTLSPGLIIYLIWKLTCNNLFLSHNAAFVIFNRISIHTCYNILTANSSLFSVLDTNQNWNKNEQLFTMYLPYHPCFIDKLRNNQITWQMIKLYFIQVNFDIKEEVLYDFTIFSQAAGNSWVCI